MKNLCFVIVMLGLAANVLAQSDADKAACEDISKAELKQAVEQAGGLKWPKYSKMRFVEDYTKLSSTNAPPQRDFFDSLKNIPLNEAGDWYVSFGGQARWRFENYRNFNFGAKKDNDDSYFLQRYFLHADVHMGEHFRVFTEIKSAFANDYDLAGGPRPLSMHDEFDVHNIFGDFKFDLTEEINARLRGGRWEINYGKGRMIGCRNWSQLRRSFDGGKLKIASDSWWAEGFWGKWVNADKYEPFNSTNQDIEIWGVYGHISTKTGLPFNVEPYILAKANTTGTKDEHRATVGGRIFGDIKETNFSYDVEGGYQFDYDGTDVSAGFFSVEATYTFKEVQMTPWVTAGFDWASGDDDPTDDEIKTFEGVSPYGHYYFGYIDEIGRQNIISPWIRIGCKPTKKLTTMIEAHWFWADESADGIHSPCNCTKVVRPGVDGADDYIGFEIDLVAKYKFNHHLSGVLGYSYLWAGGYVDDTRTAGNNFSNEDIQRLYMQLQFTF